MLMNSHPLISREQNYAFERKQLSVHSSDRNKSLFPEGNDFEFTLPCELNAVQGVTLGDIVLPPVSAIPIAPTACGFVLHWGEVRSDGSGLASHIGTGITAMRRSISVTLDSSQVTSSMFSNTPEGKQEMVALIQNALDRAQTAVRASDINILERVYKSKFIEYLHMYHAEKRGAGTADLHAEDHVIFDKAAFETVAQKYASFVRYGATSPLSGSSFPDVGFWWVRMSGPSGFNSTELTLTQVSDWIHDLPCTTNWSNYTDDHPSDGSNPIEWGIYIAVSRDHGADVQTLGLAGSEKVVASLDGDRVAFAWHRPFYISDLSEADGLPTTFLQYIGIYSSATKCMATCSDRIISCSAPTASSVHVTQGVHGDDTYVVKGGRAFHIEHENVIYMELDNLNDIGELYPASNNPPGHVPLPGKSNAAFARIPLSQTATGVPIATVMRAGPVAMNLTVLDPPRDKLSKLRVRFRYHNGGLANFEGKELSFTLLFDILHNEIPRSLTLRTPLGLRST